ncbi:MAG TPA: sigma-70 family RNA polymerase sigma factor [Polyangiaceae bacterium]|jgi:RNA polymerase sigma-70 factor (ECF subfamily)|nr:sigma-70 family RNA polymerase sigma factor [Polyangiaceae bacterium]
MDSVRRSNIHNALVSLSGGDRSAFAALVDDLWPVVLSFAQRALGRSADSEDVAQEVFYRICSRIADFDPERDGVAWAFGIAHYEIMTLRRRLQRRREIHDQAALMSLADPGASQETQLLEHELERLLARVVADLSCQERLLLGLPGADTAASMTNPIAKPNQASPAQRKRRQRALDRLRELWSKIHGDT